MSMSDAKASSALVRPRQESERLSPRRRTPNKKNRKENRYEVLADPYLPNDKRVIVDGPFADTKEVMGGCYVLECGSIEEAVKWAKRMPNYGHGSIEVRPIWETL